jgi:hypothetical protein
VSRPRVAARAVLCACGGGLALQQHGRASFDGVAGVLAAGCGVAVARGGGQVPGHWVGRSQAWWVFCGLGAGRPKFTSQRPTKLDKWVC